MIIKNESELTTKQRKAYEYAKFLSNINYDYFFEVNPSRREYIKAVLEKRYIIIDIEECDWVSNENDIFRYENETNIVPIRLLKGKALVWLKDGTEIGEDEKGWYYVENNEKVYRFIKV